MPDKIVMVTTGQPSTNPRMLKEVETLLQAGYLVKVFYVFWTHWAFETDKVILQKYPGVFVEVGGNPVNRKITYFFSRILHKACRIMSGFPSLYQYTFSRATLFLELAAKKEQADLYIAHNLGALPAAVKAAKRRGKPCGFDAEDYHPGELKEGDPQLMIVNRIENNFIKQCDYITAAAPLIGAAYQKRFPKQHVTTINNAFSIRFLQSPAVTSKNKLRLFWFSQRVGPDRGLETIVQALAMLNGHNITLHLVGAVDETYKSELVQLSKADNKLYFIEPMSADKLFSYAAGFDVGIASEVPLTNNRDYCLTNKLFTYLLAGNAILASHTLAQEQFMLEDPGIGLLYKFNDATDAARQLDYLYTNREQLEVYKNNAITLAKTKYNWEKEAVLFMNTITSTLRKG